MNNIAVTEDLDQTIWGTVDAILHQYNRDSSRLVDLLLAVQRVIPKQYIPKEIALYIADNLQIPLVKVYDVITFYSALSQEPRGRNVIQYCNSVVCRLNGHHGLVATLTEILGVEPGQATEDGHIWLEASPCFGACDISPAIRINGQVYGRLTSREALIEALVHAEVLDETC